MTYVSHTVRSLRRDPVSGETVRLVVTLGDDAEDGKEDADESPDENENVDEDTDTDEYESAESVREAVEAADGEVVRELQFERLLVEVEQTEIDTVCELDEVTNVETDAVLGYPDGE
ncbi:hypothetical protein [Halorussus halophilus]|uniref:hypothetical protein n=1 Tax=Halorussus halophilus TaxID=2650975 RepID=UPI0013010292|nr:hypothetical protein [Halorussus halophilus]